MDGGESGNTKRIGSVKAAQNLYGENFFEGNSPLKKPLKDFSEPSQRKRDLHLARRDIDQFKESTRNADSAKAIAEFELSDAKKTVRDLALRIEESNSRLRRIEDLDNLKKTKRRERSAQMKAEDYQYGEVMREVELIKQELSKLKLDMASVLEEKWRAERETEASSSKIWSYTSSVEAYRKEVEELSEEHVLVELARIEALKEYGAIEAQRKEDAKQFSLALEEKRKKLNELIEETDRAKELEMKLAATTSDIDMLQNELALVKKMDKSAQRFESLKHQEASSLKPEVSDSPSLLQSLSEELEAAKQELASIKEEGFQFMASMDIIRNELEHVSAETARLKEKDEKADLTVQSLNSKLLRARSKLEAVFAAEEKSNSIISNLAVNLEQLKREAEAAKKEKELISEETAKIKAELPKTEAGIELAEERLQAAIEELKAVKSSEAIALEKLKNVSESTMRARASASQHSSTITITTFEYNYLKGRAAGAGEIADKKVAAEQAWIEALKASEKEILMKTEMAHREIRELRVEEEHEVYKTQRTLSAKKAVEGEIWKTLNRDGITTPARRAKFRKSGSPGGWRVSRSSSLKGNRRKGVQNLAKFFSSKNSERGR